MAQRHTSAKKACRCQENIQKDIAREVKIKTMRYHYIFIKEVKFRTLSTPDAGKDVE